MNYTNKKIHKNTSRCILYIIILLPFLSLSAVRSMISASSYQQWQILGVGLLFFVVAFVGKSIKLDSFIAYLTVYEALEVMVSSVRYGFSPGIMGISAAFVLLTILVEVDSKAMLKTLAIISLFIIIANAVSLVGSPIDENKQYFIGGKNSFSMTLIPAMAFYIIYITDRYGKLRFLDKLVLLCAIAQMLYGKSGTGIICTVVALVMFVFNKSIKSKKTLIMTIIILNVLFLFAFDFVSETRIWNDITSWLDKSSTLTARTTIWSLAKDNISNHWLIGNGRGIELSYVNLWGERQNIFEAHNIFLQVLMCNGVIGLIIYVKYLLKAIGEIDLSNYQQKILFIAIFVCLINGLTESNCDSTLFRLLIAFAYYANNLKEENNEEIKA